MEKMIVLSKENSRYGYRRVWALVRREDFRVNKKRVYRLWREEGLRVPSGQRKRRKRLGSGENGCTRRRAERGRAKDQVWSYNFVMDRMEDKCRLKMMPVMDESSRECISIEVKRPITAKEVKTLATLFAQRGEPTFIRSDNGPEFIAKAVKRWLATFGVNPDFPDPIGSREQTLRRWRLQQRDSDTR